MFNVRLAGGHLYGKQLFTWLSLVVSLMASFVLSFFPLDGFDEIWDLIESVSEGFLTYSFLPNNVEETEVNIVNFLKQNIVCLDINGKKIQAWEDTGASVSCFENPLFIESIKKIL